MVPINLTCPHFLQHFFFEHLFHLYYKEDILKGLHDHVGHPGIERTLRLMRERFFWPGGRFIKICDAISSPIANR